MMKMFKSLCMYCDAENVLISDRYEIFLCCCFLLPSVTSPRAASYDELTVFHDSEYIDFLKRISGIEDEEKYDEEAQQFGLSRFPF